MARAAVRVELARAALTLFMSEGFDAVTVTDVAAAAGVSRSTFLRYFATKEEAALAVLDSVGPELAEGLAERPATESDWVALRRAMDRLLLDELDSEDETKAGARNLIRFIYDTPPLHAALLAKYNAWLPMLAGHLTARGDGDDFRSRVLVAAALDCMRLSAEQWVHGGDGFPTLLDRAFDLLAPRP